MDFDYEGVDISEKHPLFLGAAKHFSEHKVSCDGRVWIDDKYGIQLVVKSTDDHLQTLYRVLDVDGMPVERETSQDMAFWRVKEMIRHAQAETSDDHDLRCAAVRRAITKIMATVNQDANSFSLNLEKAAWGDPHRYSADIEFRRDVSKTIVIEGDRAQVEQLLALDADAISRVVETEQELTEIVEEAAEDNELERLDQLPTY